ncbi:MAG TPA: VTC domain-containing protein [Acidimicrobiales bacterium]
MPVRHLHGFHHLDLDHDLRALDALDDLDDHGDHHALAALAPIGLDELAAFDDLQTRRDRKYLLPLPDLDPVLAGLAPGTRVLTIDGVRTFRYESVYFDTPDLAGYLGAARRRPRRFKVRTRAYLDTGGCMLEVKVCDGRGNTVKHRHPHDIARRSELDDEGRAFVASIPQAAHAARRLRPTLTTTYRRTTLVLPGGGRRGPGTGGAARVTIDVALAWAGPDRAATGIDHLALVETKTTGAPCTVDRALWRQGHRPGGISKYGTGLAALRPDLPANKWNRVLRRHFGWRPDRRGRAVPT